MNIKSEGSEEIIPLYPVAGLTIGPVPALGIVIIRPDFLTHAMQAPEDAQSGRNYALTQAQALYLVEKIQSALAHLETSPPPTGLGPQH